jgi:hypothetical protein
MWMQGEGIPPIRATGHGEAVREWSVAEGAPAVSSFRELPQLSEFDATERAHSDALLQAMGHTDPHIRETRAGRWKFTCGCGYAAASRSTKGLAIEAASLHLTRAIDRALSRARQSGISLAAAAEFEKRAAGGVSGNGSVRKAG